MIVAFVLAIISASEFFFLDLGTIDWEEQLEDEDEIEDDIDEDFIETVVNVCGAIILISGLFLLIGGIFAIKRIHWGVALLGAILGVFTIGPWFLGTVLSLVALVLIFLSKEEFKGKGEEKGENEQYISPTSSEKQTSEPSAEQK